MGYRDTDKNMRTIGEELRVATILEGGVRRAGDTVRINVQLIDAETDENIWAETYDRQLSAENIFAIQREMAISIAKALEATLSSQETVRLNELPTQSTRAYDFFLNGNGYARRNDRETFTPLAVQMYERAVEEDPEFALALASLSTAHSGMVLFGVDRTDSRRRMAEEAVQRALDLAPNLPEAHLAMGYYHYWGFRNYDSALRELVIAEQGMPGSAEILEARAYVQRRLAHWEDSIASMDRAMELDPRNNSLPFEQARTYEALHDYSRAEELLDRALEVAPDDVWSYVQKAQQHLLRDGDAASVLDALENAPMALGDYGRSYAYAAALYGRDHETALKIVTDFEADPVQRATNFIPRALMYGEIHQSAGQPALAERAFQAARTQVEAALENSPEDPRLYVALGRTLAGLEEPEAAISAAHRAIDLLPTSRDAYFGPRYQLDAVMILLAAGDHTAAIEELDACLAAPVEWSIEGLLPDPRLDPIRDDPRFQALVEKHKRQ
jgi:serine/threonine-protein kinase